jgi:hypothetical protein
MGLFDSDSAFGQEDRMRKINAAGPFLRARTDQDAEVAQQAMQRMAAESGPPIEHWHHDLTTVDILLDQDPPDVDRARRLLDEVRQEMYRRLR